MFNILKRIFKLINHKISVKDNYITGAISDSRTVDEVTNAYDDREVTSAFPIQWIEKTNWKTYPVKRQYYTSECVAQSTTKQLAINNIKDKGAYIDLSPEFFYWYRTNKPGEGMVWIDAMKISVDKGSCTSGRIQQRFRDSDISPDPTADMIKEALEFKGSAYVEDKIRTIDSIASIIESQGSCLLWFWFDKNGIEWWNYTPTILYPNLGTYDDGATRHAVIAVDYGLRNGKKVIKIEDSAGNSTALNDQDRFIDENFLKRCFVSGYVIDLPNAKASDKSNLKFTGTRNLTIGSRGEDVRQLQAILKELGMFPDINPTGYFGGITRQSVIKLQSKYADDILKPVGLTLPTGYVGRSTLTWLSKHYA